jgi:hypothetical protein
MPVVPDQGQEPAEVPPEGAPENEVQEPVREPEPEEDDCPDLEPQDGDDSDSESEDSDDENEQEQRPTTRRSVRIARGVRPPDKLTMASQKLCEGKHNSEEQNASIKRAKIDEIKQVFEELMAVKPVLKEDIPEGVRALNCHLFTVEKFKADGSHDKYKSRFVAHGNEQDNLMYPDSSSPTVGVHSIMMGLGVVACNEGYVVGKLDVKGAFIHTEMTGPPVYIKCAGELKQLILEVYSALRKYVGLDGLLYCKLLKAVYGCVQASKLWYEKLCAFLEREGYERSATDPCVFRKVEGQCVYVLLVYVDDILVCAKQEELERMKRAFIGEFKWITADVGDKHSYLGMQLTISKGCIEVNMQFYIEKILAAYGDLREYATPGTKDIFMVDEKAAVLPEKEQKLFHTTVARLLYLSKRARPDILGTVGFLCTRVKVPTVEDVKKLERLLGYLKGTQSEVMELRPRRVFRLEAYIEASFSAHPDGKSHSGMVVLLAGVPVYFSSKKQKCVSKSPTEAELVALSDNVGAVELFQELACFLLNTNIPIPTIYQDSTSVISLVTQGGGMARTKHLRTRMFLVKEAIQEDKIKVKFVATEDMLADGLTKALDGTGFRTFAQMTMGRLESVNR